MWRPSPRSQLWVFLFHSLVSRFSSFSSGDDENVCVCVCVVQSGILIDFLLLLLVEQLIDLHESKGGGISGQLSFFIIESC